MRWLAARRAGAALVCGGGGAERWSRRCGDRLENHGLARSTIIAAARSRCTTAAEGAGSPCRRRSPVGLRERSGARPRAQALGRAGDAGRSDATVDLGVEEHGEACRDLTQMGHPISADTVCTELVKLGFSRQSNRKADEGSKHPDRTPSSNTSTRKSLRRRPNNNPSSPSIPRRRNWLATSRMAELIIVPKAIRSA